MTHSPPERTQSNTFYGDAGGDMTGHSKGGNDTFNGALFATQVFYGDAGGNMSGHAEGGDDRFTGSGGAISVRRPSMAMPAVTFSGFAKGGNDTFINEGGSTVSFYGDAGATMSGHAQGGNDLATLLGTKNFAVGDAVTMLDATSGGNDSLSGGDSSVTDVVNQLYGDAQVMGGATSRRR